MRYTKAEVIGMLGRLMKALPEDKSQGLSLDYNAIYGGYVIVRKHMDTSETHPFGNLRRDTKAMYLSMLMAAEALEQRGEK